MRLKKFIGVMVVTASILFGLLAAPAPVYAAGVPGCNQKPFFLMLPTWYEYLKLEPRGNDQCAIKPPPDDHGVPDLSQAAGLIGLAVVDILLRIGGLVAVFAIIFGGIRLILSEGEPDKYKQAKGTIFNAIIGMIIVLIATALVNFIGKTLIPG